MITGLFETHIDVRNLDRACHFYGETLGLELGLRDPDRRVAFYWIGSRGEAMLGLWEKPAEQVRPQHFAFRASIEDILTRAVPYQKERNLPARNFLDDGVERPMVFGWMPALAVYFPDPDGPTTERNSWRSTVKDMSCNARIGRLEPENSLSSSRTLIMQAAQPPLALRSIAPASNLLMSARNLPSNTSAPLTFFCRIPTSS